jgi:Undecaprenyl-phosphate galactose phosphotransferase WbaP
MAAAVLSREQRLGGDTLSSFADFADALGSCWPFWLLKAADVAILLITDVSALLIATGIGYLLWIGPVLHQSPKAYVNLAPLLWLFPLGYAEAGLYPGFGLGAVEILRRLSSRTSFAFLIVAAASFVLKLPEDHSRMGFALAWCASLISVPLLRFLVLSVVSRWAWWREPAILVGNSPWIRKAFHSLEDALSLGYRPVGVLSPDSRQYGHGVRSIPNFGGLELAPLLAEQGVHVAIMEEADARDSILSYLQQHFHRVVVMREYGDLPVEPVQVCNLGGALGLEFTNNLLHWQNRLIKRTLDIVLGVILLCLALPLIVLSAVAIKLTSRGPIFFSQRREGLARRPLKVLKLRTMYWDAEQRLDKFLLTHPAQRREWESHFKLANDPRVIAGVGKLLRRFSLDELPQVVSVIKGEMSFVGPRPFPEYHLRKLPPEFRELRQRVRPGLTGLWQVMIRSSGGLAEQKMYDTYYIRNWSLWLDVYILARTVVAVLTGRGAY